MKILKIAALLSFITTISIVGYYFIVGNNSVDSYGIQEVITQNNNEIEYNKFIADSKKMIDSKSFPLPLGSNTDIIDIVVEGYSLIHYLSTEESYRPGEENGLSKRLTLSILEDIVRTNFCKQSYFKRLPIAVEFRYSVKGTQYDIEEYPPLILKTQKVCGNENN